MGKATNNGKTIYIRKGESKDDAAKRYEGKEASRLLNELVFSPSKTDEVSQKVSRASDIKLSRSTITLKGENGKTIGMIRGLERFSDMKGGKEFSAYQELKKYGLGRDIARENIYFDGKQVYVLNNTRHAKFLSASSKSARGFLQSEIDKLERKNKMLKNAEDKGAIIINYG